MNCTPFRRVIPAGLYHTVLASSAIAAPPANALPIPEALCSAIWKKAADAGADAAASASASTGLRILKRVASVLLARETSRPAQRLQRQHHFAPVAARDRRHEHFEGLRPGGERRLDRVEALTFEARRLGDGRFDAASLAEGERQIKARLGACLRAAQRRIERQRAEARLNDEVAVGLEARGERPVHLLVRKDVDS